MSKHNLCNNCGKQGHQFHQCKLPITSYGIILFRSSSKGIQYLMIRRKDSFGYIDFLRGKYVQNNLEHLESLFNEMSIYEREKIRKLMEEKDNIVAIAVSKIFSTGINIPNLHNIIFASAGKAKIKIMQSIGRALRLHPTKTMATIIDVADNTKYGKIHLNERLELYTKEKYNYEKKEIQ